jgi:hypothetical protein
LSQLLDAVFELLRHTQSLRQWEANAFVAILFLSRGQVQVRKRDL